VAASTSAPARSSSAAASSCSANTAATRAVLPSAQAKLRRESSLRRARLGPTRRGRGC
jgi:hypothetical protein